MIADLPFVQRCLDAGMVWSAENDTHLPIVDGQDLSYRVLLHGGRRYLAFEWTQRLADDRFEKLSLEEVLGRSEKSSTAAPCESGCADGAAACFSDGVGKVGHPSPEHAGPASVNKTTSESGDWPAFVNNAEYLDLDPMEVRDMGCWVALRPFRTPAGERHLVIAQDGTRFNVDFSSGRWNQNGTTEWHPWECAPWQPAPVAISQVFTAGGGAAAAPARPAAPAPPAVPDRLVRRYPHDRLTSVDPVSNLNNPRRSP